MIEPLRRAGAALPPLHLLGGDLLQTLGGDRGSPPRESWVVPADLGSVLLDGRQHWFVAHLVARRSWWRGRVVAVMNAEHIGRWDVAPRGHPNDGRLDIVDVAASMPFTARWQAWRRLPTGTHLPHPSIAVERTAAWSAVFDRPLRVWLDGDPIAEVKTVSVRVEPDALRLVV